MSLISNFKYRKEIDGLRALAVVPVVLFHAGLSFPGGFTGVDVFFVISGYLITSLIVRDVELGRFSFAGFWERRARRILPASTVVVLFTLALGGFLLVPEDGNDLGVSATWQSFFAANIYFEQEINYFSNTAEEMPLLHMWSLAVEEQFYFAMPFLLFLVLSVSAFRNRVRLLGILIALALVSFLYGVFEVRQDQQAAFFLLPSRAWELLLGSIVALLPVGSLPGSRTVRSVLSLSGLSLIFLSYFLFDDGMLFPGEWALLPCVGTALFIWASASDRSGRESIATRAIGCGALVFIGKISYSVYLWHWPLIAFSNYWRLFDFYPFMRVGVPVLSIFLGVLSWRFIETPFRVKILGRTRVSMLLYGSVFIVAVFVASGVCRYTDGFTFREDAWIRELELNEEKLKEYARISRKVTYDDVLSKRFLSYEYGDSEKTDVFVWGDSHARSLVPSIVSAAEKHKVNIEFAWHPSTAPVLNAYSADSPWSMKELTLSYNLGILNHIKEEKIPRVLLVGFWSANGSEGSVVSVSGQSFEQEVVSVCRELIANGSRVSLMRDWPEIEIDAPRLVYAREVLGVDASEFSNDRVEFQAYRERMETIIPTLEGMGVKILDPERLFWSEEDQRYRIDDANRALYSDRHHLSVFGAMRFLSLVEEAIED